MSRELKIERSIPVQGRVDIKSLAELDLYWKSIGVEIRSMSQLLSWSVDAFHTIIKKNGQLEVELESVADCHNHLELRGLYQGSMKKRAIAKVNAAMRFENLRYEGVDPAVMDSREYNIVHNKNNVEPIYSDYGRVSDKEYKRVMGISREEARKLYESTGKVKIYDKEHQPKIDMESLMNKDTEAIHAAKVKVVDDKIANMPDLPSKDGLVKE